MAPPRNRRPGFSRRAHYGLFIGYVGAAGGALIGAVLLLLSTFNPPAFAAVRSVFSEITTPVSSGLHWVRRGLGGIPEGIGSYFAVHGENARLKKQIAKDALTVARAQTLEQENRRLRELVKLRDVTTDAIVAARLVNSSSSSTRRYATLNAGSWQGVKRGQPVRNPSGLIGQVIETSPNSARVLLLVDPESIVPVRRVRDGLPAIASGRGDGLVDIRSASVSTMGFRVGDVFVTSGTGGVYSPDIVVAKVIRTQGDIAVGQPAANPDALDFALVQQTFLPEPTPTPTPSPSPSASPKPAQ
ncbi:rod shape-determining protein MreC [Sphingomonas psychrotolerans]|uniref:Cell shape-determining protein MreC n=1 Tax=Sphingomonas psychrotolerans TaxID=1327635 RepID=A0ABU3N1H2_9SPHN|nr:rod shape-determining protein MreC [Sphingomonas psychrotolerans]MDT8758400.1 rod shape-determining protein MreC [Sphingomonas psychrotolerans]